MFWHFSNVTAWHAGIFHFTLWSVLQVSFKQLHEYVFSVGEHSVSQLFFSVDCHVEWDIFCRDGWMQRSILSCTVKIFAGNIVQFVWCGHCDFITFQYWIFVSFVNLCKAAFFKHLFRDVGWLYRFCDCAQISHLPNPCITARLCESPGVRYNISCLKQAMWNVYLKPNNGGLTTTAGMPLVLLFLCSEHPMHRCIISDFWPLRPRRWPLQP